jgi:hypothetical protein
MEEKYKIHAAYILLILVSIIVVLITVRWSQIPNLAELITFALTLSSLILAALAIGYAVYSNSSLTQSISTLNNVSSNVSLTSKGISRAAEDLSRKIETIPSKLESVEGKVEQTNVLLKQYSERQESQTLDLSKKQQEQIPDQNEKEAVDEIADSYLAKISLSGIFILYGCAIAYKKKAPFDLEKFCESIPRLNPKYTQGFLVATDSAGLLSYNELNGIYSILEMHEGLRQSLLSEFEARLSNTDEEENWTLGISKEEYKKLSREQISLIEAYFQ